MTKNVFSYSLDEWARGVYHVYETPNSKRTLFDMWMSVLETASEVAEALRKPAYEDALSALAYNFAWFCAFHQKCQRDREPYLIPESLSDVIALKYPNLCGHCELNKCACGNRRIEMEEKKNKVGNYEYLVEHRNSFHYRDKTVDDWINVFRSIYGNSIYATNTEGICFHWFEELGEVAKALRKLAQLAGVNEVEMHGANALWSESPGEIKRQIDSALGEDKSRDIDDEEIEKLPLKYQVWWRQLELRFELADAFSWFCSLALKLEWVFKGIQPRFTPQQRSLLLEKLVQKYLNPKGNSLWCPHPACHMPQCGKVYHFRDTAGATGRQPTASV